MYHGMRSKVEHDMKTPRMTGRGERKFSLTFQVMEQRRVASTTKWGIVFLDDAAKPDVGSYMREA
jgi:hypothetical protein